MKRLLLAAFFSAAASLAPAQPIDVRIDRTSDRFNLGLSEFVPQSRQLSDDVAKRLHGTLARDFQFSRIFNLVDGGPRVAERSDAANWAQFGTQAVLAGEIRPRRDEVEIEAELIEVETSKVLVRIRKRGPAGDLTSLGHQVADEVVKYFTGESGIFTSRIVFVNDQTGRKELFVADYDGANARRLTNDNSIVILPRISASGEKIIFTSYRTGNPDLWLINADGSGRRVMSSKAGLNVAPSWAPSGDGLAVTLSIDGPPNVYLMDLDGRVLRRLTDGRGADTAPTFSPDGRQIAFTSDRAGSPHIYVINVDGSGLRRLTTEGHCDSPAWSPDGRTILYVKAKSGSRFDIYSIEVLTGVERRLTWGEGDNENPAWSPDSRSVLFTSNRRGRTELWVMAADGTEQRPLGNIKGQSFTPHWSR